MKKKILALALCMLLVANPCFAASTGVVTVSGGSIATGGLSGGYSQATESAAITLTMALLHGLGVSIKLSQDAINAGQSAYSFVRNKFAEWVGGTSAEELTDSQYDELKKRFEVINGGSNIDPDGKIYFSPAVIALLQKFLKWADERGEISNSIIQGGGSQETVEINGINTLYTQSSPMFNHNVNNANRHIQFNFDKKVVFVQWIGSNAKYPYNLGFYCNEPFTGVAARYNTKPENILTENINSNTNPINGYYYKVYSYNAPDEWTGVGYIPKALNLWLADLDGSFVPDDSSGTQENEGLNYEGDFDPSVLNNPDDNNLVVNPDLVQGLQENNPNQQINIPVEQYLEALKQILNQATNPQAVPEPIPAQDLPTLSPVPVDVPADLPLEWPVELPSSPDATPDLPTDNTPVTDPSTPVNPVDALPELTFNLDEYFPFCIPFDVYHLLSKFSADPVTPVFDIGFTEPFTNSNVNFHIDLSPWDSVASAIRTAELGAFIVGLAVASRAIFTRG